jgi:hypothetical protein
LAPQPVMEHKVPAKNEPLPSAVPLRYLENSRVLVRGPATGRNYDFSTDQPVQPVAVADAGPLLRTGIFREDRWAPLDAA